MSEATLSPSHEAAELGDNGAGGVRHKRILLVEGDGFTRLVLLLRLRLAGFNVDFTSNGMLGLGKLRSCQPDILLVELKLYGMSGLDLIKAARAEPSFGDRPIYVFTHADRMNRATRKEVTQLATKVFDKSSTTREDLVQTFASIFRSQEAAVEVRQSNGSPESTTRTPSETVPPEAIQEIVAGVQEQSERLARERDDRVGCGGELLSRVCSLTSCASAAGLPNLARQAKALENFLVQLCRNNAYKEPALRTISRSVAAMGQMCSERNGTESGLRKFSALVIDEAPDSNRALQEALRDAAFEPHCFSDPARARAFLASNPTEVIIANVLLPEAHSLALTDIRQLPLHAETKVIFGPDSTVTAPLGERLPTNAARLDNEPLLLSELVVKALNELQSPESESEAAPEAAPADPIVGRQGSNVAAASPTFEDGFELFARSGSVPNQPILRVAPDLTDADHVLEARAPLPAASTDASQIEEHALEAFPTPDLQTEELEPPQPEPENEDHKAAAAWLAAASIETSQRAASRSATPEFEDNGAAVAEQPVVVPTNYEEDMNQQLQQDPAYSPANEQSQPAPGLQENSEQEDLAARVYAAETALHHAQMELEQRDKAITALQEHLAEATADQAQAANRLAADPPVEEAARLAQARCAELEQELAAMRQALEDFNGSFGQQQQAAAEAGKYVEELEQRLSQNQAEQEKLKEAQQQTQGRCAQLEAELGTLRQTKEELANKLAQEQKAGAESAAQLKQLQTQSTAAETGPGSAEQQIRQGVAALARVTAELAKERGERQRSEQRTAELNERLQALHQDLGRTLQAQRQDLARITTLEEQQRQTSQALDRRTADVEQLQAERQLAQEQLQKTKEINAQLRKDLSFFDEINKKFGGTSQELQAQLEASLNAAREHEAMLAQKNAEQQRLAESLERTKQELQNQTRRHESLEQELKAARQVVQDRDARVEKEAAERQRLQESLDSAQRNARGGSERDLEFSKLQSALQLEQVERKRQETQLARMRHSALESAHAARALRTGLRRQIREPVDNLVVSARSLLETEMGEAQKKLAEAVLQDVLLVQTRLREPELPHSDSSEAAPAPAETT